VPLCLIDFFDAVDRACTRGGIIPSPSHQELVTPLELPLWVAGSPQAIRSPLQAGGRASSTKDIAFC
jgi:hypothetical protein